MFRLSNSCFEISAVYTITLLILYTLKRDATIPLSYRTVFDNWGALKSLFTDATAPLTWPEIDAVVWCPPPVRSASSQCGCFYDYFNATYYSDLLGQNLTQTPLPADAAARFVSLGQKHATGIVTACLRHRPSWRKNLCGEFCRVHLSVPVMLACLYMCVFFFVSSTYSRAWGVVPWALALVAIALNLGLDHNGGIISALSIISVLLEVHYTTKRTQWREQTFWSYHRFLCGALAVWAGATHQARDVVLLASYGMLGFFIGFLSYAVFLVKQGAPCRHSGSISLYLYIGIGAIVACFILLIQQHWYAGSPMWASAVSVLVFGVALLQCFSQTPYHAPPVRLNILISLGILTAAFLAAVADLVSG